MASALRVDDQRGHFGTRVDQEVQPLPAQFIGNQVGGLLDHDFAGLGMRLQAFFHQEGLVQSSRGDAPGREAPGQGMFRCGLQAPVPMGLIEAVNDAVEELLQVGEIDHRLVGEPIGEVFELTVGEKDPLLAALLGGRR